MASKSGPLLEHLEEAWKARNSGTPALDDLWLFDLPIGRDKFAKAATSCEDVWKKPVPPKGARRHAGVNFIETQKVLEERFKQFNKYLADEMKTPLDFFAILKWASEPAMPGGRKTSLWANVWEELYLLAVVLGRQRAMSKWNHMPTVDATARLKAILGSKERVVTLKEGEPEKKRFDATEDFVPGSKDWGFHPKDAELIYRPFIDPGRAKRGSGPDPRFALLRARLFMHHRNVNTFADAQHLRRSATIYAKLRNLNLLHDIETTALSHRALGTDPLEAANRVWHATGLRPTQYRIGEGEKDYFTVIWIGSPRERTVWIEMHAFPGQVFMTSDPGVLAAMTEDKVFRLVAESLDALGNFMLVYLMILGFVLDIVTAGAASTTLRGLVYAFLKEKLIEAAVDKGLELARIEHKGLQLLVQAAVGMKTGAAKKLKGVEDIDRVTSFKPKPPKPEAAAPRGNTRVSADARNHFEIYDPNVKRVVTDKVRKRISKADKVQYAEDKDVIEKLAEAVAEKVAAAKALLDMRMTTMATPGGVTFHVAGAPGKGAGTPGGSLKGKADAFEKSDAYKKLQKYKEMVPPNDWKTHVDDKLKAILKELKTNKKKTLTEANEQLRNILNKAKELSGEENALVDVFGQYEVNDYLAIPIRGDRPGIPGKGAPMLDVAVRLEKGQPYWFVLIEAKGDRKTRLGKVTQKRYFYKGNDLTYVEAPTGGTARQATGEWYYQKFAEMFMHGQAFGGKEGQRYMDMALELIEAARQGKILFQVMKASPDVVKHVDDTAEVAEWFSKNLVPGPTPGSLPIPQALLKK